MTPSIAEFYLFAGGGGVVKQRNKSNISVSATATAENKTCWPLLCLTLLFSYAIEVGILSSSSRYPQMKVSVSATAMSENKHLLLAFATPHSAI